MVDSIALIVQSAVSESGGDQCAGSCATKFLQYSNICLPCMQLRGNMLGSDTTARTDVPRYQSHIVALCILLLQAPPLVAAWLRKRATIYQLNIGKPMPVLNALLWRR
jgi:hypothetical protein